MKYQILKTILSISTLLTFNSALAIAVIGVDIKGAQAKHIYNLLTGPAVENEGAAGHLYRTGKNIVCIYTNVEMEDAQGRAIPMKDPRHYVCKLNVNRDGVI